MEETAVSEEVEMLCSIRLPLLSIQVMLFMGVTFLHSNDSLIL